MALMISVSGIRGIFGKELVPENLARFTAAFGTWLKGGKVVVGRDSRVTGKVCEDIVIATLQSVGCDVIRVGIVPTPTVALGVLKHKASGAVMISASHNPAEWNALKLLNEKSEYLDADQGKEVIDIADNGQFSYVGYRDLGSVTDDPDMTDYHIREILNLPYIDPKLIARQNFRVAVDAVNGAGSEIVPLLLENLGVLEVDKLNCTPDGLFPHNPEPLPQHLEGIMKLVRQSECDLGFVVDPDADRLALIMNGGEFFGEEYTIALATDFMLGKKKGVCVVNLSSSMITRDIARKHEVKSYQAAVGEINVVKEMQHRNAVIGGEGNGGVINPDLHYGRDALVGIAMTLQFLAEKQTDLKTYRSQLPDYQISKNKITLDGMDPDKVLESIADEYRDKNPITIDGVKIETEQGWVHLRKSNTEPIIRVYSESTSRKNADDLARQFIDKIHELVNR